jgi:dihydropteroate synthase
MGILNITENSFSDGNIYNSTPKAIERVNKLFDEGADLIDIGAVATSYGAKAVSHEEEWSRLEPILKQIGSDRISLDTFNYITAKKALKYKIGFINDVNFGREKEMLALIADHPHIKYILMFSLVVPADRNIRVKDVREIEVAFEKKIEECQKTGIKIEQLVLDPGIGFGTNAEQSFHILKNISVYRKYGAQILIGHSRKSFFEMITNYLPQERDLETVIASLYLKKQEVDYLRVHNISWHKRAFKVFETLGF